MDICRKNSHDCLVSNWLSQIDYRLDDAVRKSRANVLNFKRVLQVVFVKDQVAENNVVIYVWDGTDASLVNSIPLYSHFLQHFGLLFACCNCFFCCHNTSTQRRLHIGSPLKHLPATWQWGLRTKSLVSLLKVYYYQ